MQSNWVFIFTVLLIFLAIEVESCMLWIEWNHQILSKRWGEKAFTIHSRITSTLWSLASVGILLSISFKFPTFHNLPVLIIFGWIFFALGMIIATLGFNGLGLDRSLAVNFFKEEERDYITSGIYRFIKHPEEYGFWIMMIGLALGTTSTYVLIFAAEFIILMIPHQKIENLPLKK